MAQYPVDPRTVGAVQEGFDMADTADREGYLSGVGLGKEAMIPRLRPDKGINVGKRNIVPGGTMEALRPYFAELYKQFVSQPLGDQPHQRALGIAAKIGVGGYLGAQEQREAKNTAELKRVEDLQKERRGKASEWASGLATHRQNMRRDEANRAAGGKGGWFTLPDGTQVPMTAAIASGLAGKQGVIPQRAEVGIRPKIDPETMASLERVADGIQRGDASPDINDYGRDANVRVALTDMLLKRGMNARTESQKYLAEKVFLRSANGTIALRGMRNVVNARESLDYVEQLLNESAGVVPRGRFTSLNRGQMFAAAEGIYGPEAAASARKLKAQVAAIRFELSNIYMGGTAPTDQAVKKAMDVIDSNWSEAGLRGAIELARRDLGIRVNAIKEVGPITLEGGQVMGAPQPTGFPADTASKDSRAIDAWLGRKK